MSDSNAIKKKYGVKRKGEMSEKTQKEIRNAVAAPGDNDGSVVPVGQNAFVLNRIMMFSGLPRIDLQNPAEVSDRTAVYFQLCVENDIKPAVSSYALALGTTRQAVAQIKCGRKKVPRAVYETIEKASALMDALIEGYMLDGKVNPVSGIFLMKNNHGYSNGDKPAPEYDISQNNERTSEEIKEKYKNIVD